MAEAELKELVTKMVQSSDQQQAQIILQQQQITGLIEALQNMPGVHSGILEKVAVLEIKLSLLPFFR